MYPMQPQKMGRWCWAAVALSVDTFLNPATPWEQCSIASAVRGIQCCTDPLNEACNRASSLRDALNCVGRYSPPTLGRVDFSVIQSDLDRLLPVCVRVAWLNGGAHFLVISGYHIDAGEVFVELSDSIYGYSTYRFERFANAYRGIGRWTHTYRVS